VSQSFISILEKSGERELLPFLKTLANDDKKKLAPEIKALSKEYLEYKEVKTGPGTTQYKQIANDAQQSILLLTSFVCFNRKDFEKISFPGWILDEKYLNKVIDWYCPDWFSDFVNKLAEQDFMYHTFKYQQVLELTEKGFLNPSKQLVVKLLPQTVFESVDRTNYFKPENILTNPVTIQEHIWYLFEEESNLHYCNRWLQFGKDVSKEQTSWIDVFKKYSAEGRIDRIRLLQEALLASNRNFNKILSGWFSDLFVAMEPTDAELLNLQKELFSVLNAPQSKPVNTALQFIKKLVTNPQFDGVSFLDQAPVLLTSETKSTVACTLMILEKLSKKNKQLQVQICYAATAVFVLASDELQERAAKIIALYQQQLGDDFAGVLQPYHPSLMASARKLLDKFYTAEAASVQDEINNTGADINTIPEVLTEIVLPETIDDLVFLASQAFDNNQSWHIDLLPAAIIYWQHELKGNNINKLEPALQRALKMTTSDFRAGIGSLDHMLAIFFIDVCIYLVQKYPADATALVSIFKKFDQKVGDKISSWLAQQAGVCYMTTWDNYSHNTFYLPHKKLVLVALNKIVEADSLSLLSTPTHEQAWINPETLVARIAFYQQQNKTPESIDWQVAISRCILSDTSKAIALAETQLIGEYKNLMLFLLGHHTTPKSPFTNTSAWMCCTVALKEKKAYVEFNGFSFYKKPFECYTGEFPWQSIEEEYDLKEYDYQLKKYNTKKAIRKILKVHINRTVSKENTGLKKFFTSLVQKKFVEESIIYDHFIIKGDWLSIENDIKRLLLLAPNNTGPFLAEITKHSLKYPTFWSESDKKMVIATLQTLYEIWADQGEMAYLFLGTCMLSSDKTVANIAGEIWIKGVPNQTINSERLGAIIGRHQSIEFAPLKRLTDLIGQPLYNISTAHNQQLLLLIENILVQLPSEPIRNLKKLLEIYAELLSKSNTRINNQLLLTKLNKWMETESLQKVIKNMLE
jgi:hypothetical protein